MVLRDPVFMRPDPEDIKGTIWENVGGSDPESEAKKTHIVDIVDNGNIALAAGQGLDVELKGQWAVTDLLVDFGSDVVATVFIDGQARFRTTDKQGLGGRFRLGDGVTTYMDVRSVRIVATNTGSEIRDVRAWMVVA